MERINKFFRNFSKIIINIGLSFLVKSFTNGKVTMPRNLPNEILEVFENLNNNRVFNNKIIIPYTDVDIISNLNINKPYEILEVRQLIKNSHVLKIKESKEIILPIAILDKSGGSQSNNQLVELLISNKKITLNIKYKNRFHYLPINNKLLSNKLSISSESDNLIISKPIYRNTKKAEGKPKLILHIFIDALTQSIIEKFGYEIMPNTNKFFSNGGTFYTNTFAQSEWTLSSVAGIFTGRYTNDHLVYHPRKEDKIKNYTLADALSESGYYTFGCTNIPKLTPYNGFDKGFDRFIIALDKDYNYIINEAEEQLNAIGGNQYLFLGFFDIHEAHRLQPISSQTSNNLKDFQYKKLRGNSKDTSILYDNERINMYKNSITHLDSKLKRVYEIAEKYDKDAMVILHSDHGVNFMTKTKELLGKEREKVIFLYKNNKELNYDNSIKEIRELPSMICKDLVLNNNKFKYVNNGYSITESLYPHKEYEIAVRDNNYVLFFKVKWENIIKRNTDSYKYNSSIHKNDEENISISRDNVDVYPKLLEIAKKHYEVLIKNIRNE